MAKNPLFSTYRQGENRVTSSMLAVFERIDLSLLESILAAASGESSLQMVSFTNQPPGEGHSTPDARISARFAYWFEVKTTQNALHLTQLTEHLASLTSDAADERLFVITPDPEQPPVIEELDDHRVVWFNFRSLHEALDQAVASEHAGVSEHAAFLLRELQALLVDDGLVDSDDVVIVAARSAYPEYLRRGVYVCQSERGFRQGLTHLGFYAEGAIQTHIARIRYREDMVPFTHEEVERRGEGTEVDRAIAQIISEDLDSGQRVQGEPYQVFVLSPAGDPETILLAQPILNDTVTSAGKPWAWTLGQRYTSLAALTRPGVSVTSDFRAP